MVYTIFHRFNHIQFSFIVLAFIRHSNFSLCVSVSGLYFDYADCNRKINHTISRLIWFKVYVYNVCGAHTVLYSVSQTKNEMDFGYCVIILQNKLWFSIKLFCAIYKCNLIHVVVHFTLYRMCICSFSVAAAAVAAIATALINYAFEILLRN